jgi:hypothetical protein
MRRFTMLTAMTMALATAVAPARADAPAAPPAPATTAIAPAAMKALTSMGAYLRNLKVFQVEATTTDEDVLTDGQKIQYAGVVNILAEMPGRLRADVANDRFDRLYLYDGKTFTVLAKRLNFYASMPAPPTIGKLADKLEEDYAMDVPLVDLFRFGGTKWDAEGIKAARDIGPSNVAGTTCEQYAFQQDDIDWQIWIQQGTNPLPRKMVITTKTDDARPQHTAVYTWNLAPSYNEQTFVFEPPPGSGRIPFASVKMPARASR